MEEQSKYSKIVEWVRNRIVDGSLPQGAKLESENEIRTLFQVSRHTVRQALMLLEAEGIIEKRQGKGSFVKRKDISAGKDFAADGVSFIKEDIPVRKIELSNTITIISTYIDGYIFPRILKSMIKELESAGYMIKLLYTENHRGREKAYLKRILDENLNDPLIVEPVMSGLPNPNMNYYRMIHERGIPILFFHSYYPELEELPHVSTDDERAGYLAAQYLIDQGHTKIGGIFKSDDGQGNRRYKGMIQALYDNNLDLEESQVCWIDSEEMKTAGILELRVLSRIRKSTAWVCYNDEVGHIVTDICERNQISIPEDLSIVSVDNSELAALNMIPLTSMSHPMELLGEKTAHMMLEMINNPGVVQTYEFEPELQIRDSVRKKK